jgi:ParB-like chromosome segregation protein Spo0J
MSTRTIENLPTRQIAESISRFGFTNPVLIDDDNRILAGHGRVDAARVLGMEPCRASGSTI